MGAGPVVGELALYLGLPRSASVAGIETTACRPTAERLEAMERADLPVAALCQEFLARTLPGVSWTGGRGRAAECDESPSILAYR